MKCTFHPTHLASVRCSSCESPLCSACDHRIKGFPYCQDCIVAGIEMLRHQHRPGHAQGPGSPREAKSPLVALLLGLIPGLGAAYNGQPVKALVHFIVTAGLWTLLDVFHGGLSVITFLASMVFYFYSLYDAHHSARRHRHGADLKEEEEQLKLYLRENTNLWGGVLLVAGVLAAVHLFFPSYSANLWPVLLAGAGIYVLTLFRRQPTETEPKAIYRTPPPSVIQSGYDRSTSEFIRAEGRVDR